MQHRLIVFALTLSFSFALGCTAKQKDELTRSAKNEELASPAHKPAPTSPSTPEKVSEEIAIPQSIAGAYLTCAIRKEASRSSLESEIGCLLADATSGKKIAPNAQLSFASSGDQSKVSVLKQDDQSIYHVLYRVTGESKDLILQTVESLEAIVLYGASTVKRERISRALKPAIELDDYEAPVVREQAIDTDDAGSL